MPRFCGIVGCGSRADRDKKSFFRLPAELSKGSNEKKEFSRVRRQRWLDIIKRDDLTETKKKYLWICENHFISGRPADLLDKNNPDWVPNVNLGYKRPGASYPALARYQRCKDRQFLASKSQKTVNDPEIVDSSPADIPGGDNQTPSDSVEIDDAIPGVPESLDTTATCSTQTSLTMEQMDMMFEAQDNYVEDICDLRKELKRREINEEMFTGDNKRVRYFTGLESFRMLMRVFQLVAPHLKECSVSVLTKFQQFMFTMMQLRLNLDFHDLAYRFSVSQATISRNFYSCLNIMFRRMSKLIVWPERDVLQCKVPPTIQEVFGKKVTVIIDCFEVEIEKPSNVLAAAQTWSNYKQRHTIKYLIGICPQGTICFVSKAFGGRATDNYITENSGILEKLVPHDLILADRGFNIKDAVNLYCAEVKIPASTRGKKQLSSLEVEETRSFAKVRIHVERIIGVLRQKYRIFEGKIPISLASNSYYETSALDKIVVVTSALVNLSTSQMSFD